MRTNGTISPAATLNSPTVRMFWPVRCTGVRSTAMSGPATARQRAVVKPGDPGDDRAITKAKDKLGPHCDTAPLSDDETHHVRMHGVHRHEVNERHRALAAFEPRFQNQRVRPIPAGHA